MTRNPRRRLWCWLLLAPCLAVLCVPFFNRAGPAWLGIPFFYWYQLLWIPLSAVVIAVVYLATRERGADAGKPR
ncbi:MAG TPA: DUF3311 domain-containing protein [Burkholderiales bacterium]|nr:DUF3311 domain-containing protein [Burkholderiales bacterium]